MSFNIYLTQCINLSASTAPERSVTTSRQSSTKHHPSESANSKSKSSSSPPSSAITKDKNYKTPQSATPVKRAKHETVNNADNDIAEGPAAKKKKFYYVDAVEKLENSTSVHVPKKLLLFVGNLPEDVTKEQILEHFKRTGKKVPHSSLPQKISTTFPFLGRIWTFLANEWQLSYVTLGNSWTIQRDYFSQISH